MKKKGVKERLKRISLYGLDIKEAIRAFMRVDPGELKEHQRHFSGCFCPGDGHVRHWQVLGPGSRYHGIHSDGLGIDHQTD
jgi:hypothetical protein